MPPFKSTLIIAPHPDDEALGCGGTAVLFARTKGTLNLVIVTDGSASHAGHPSVTPAQMAAVRKLEALSSAEKLGIAPECVHFLNAKDGELPALANAPSTRLVDDISCLLTKLNPDFVLLPCRSDGSSEHDACFSLVCRATQKSACKARILEFPIWAWRKPYILLTSAMSSRTVWRVNISEVLSIKDSAIGTYASQTRPIPPDILPLLTPEFLSEFLRDDEFLFER